MLFRSQGLIWDGTNWTPTTVASPIEADPVYTADKPNILTFSVGDARYLPNVALAGDVTGNITNNTVVKIQGRSVSSNTPTNGYVLTWSTALNMWIPQPVSANQAPESDPVYSADKANILTNGATAGGDLAGTYPSPSLRNNSVTSSKLASGIPVSKIGRAHV